MCHLVRHICLVLVTTFFHCTALSKTNGVEGDIVKLSLDETPAAMLVRRESGLALVSALAETPAMSSDASKYRLISPSLIASGEAPSPPQEALSPAPPAAPPVEGQPGIQNWGPTEAPATDHTALICIIVGFIVVTIVAALIPFFVKRFGSEAGKDGTEDGGKSKSYLSQRKRQGQQRSESSSEEDQVGGDGKDSDRIEPKGYGAKRKERKGASGALSSDVGPTKDEIVEELEEAKDPRPDPQGDVEGDTPASQEAKGKSYKEARAKRKGETSTSKGPVEDSKREEGISVNAQLASDREADDEAVTATNMQTPLLASDTQTEELSLSSSAPSRSYKQDRATRKAQASSGSAQLATPSPGESGSPEVQREVGTEEVPTMASSKYGAERTSRKGKAQEESQT